MIIESLSDLPALILRENISITIEYEKSSDAGSEWCVAIVDGAYSTAGPAVDFGPDPLTAIDLAWKALLERRAGRERRRTAMRERLAADGTGE